MDLLSYSFNAAMFSFQVRDKAYSTMDANGAAKAKYLQVWRNLGKKSDLVNESAFNQKAFILLCTHGCFSRETPQLHDQL